MNVNAVTGDAPVWEASMDFSGRTVLLTGGAGGLGIDIALAFADAGARVIALDIRDDRGADLLSRAVGTTGEVLYEHVDLSQLDALPGELDRIVSAHGPVDILINNAAIYPARPFDEYTVEDYRAVQAVNVDAHVQCMLSLAPGMRARGWGRIINVASITFYGGWDKLFPYVASKGALVGLTRAWARELGPFGITVNAIAPGAFPTDAEKIHPDPEGYARFVLEHQSLKRRGSPRDIAGTMMFLASDYSAFITGQTLNVDGGWVMK
ncbi:NAD(P)-dependent dehydrogenase (short-subunit alcohol dehydrogenase family) [Tepidamorphus gemmatus]|jgi:3-oxoacyl-[acyl-carrier protein] reductase|uniref:NAD(P)-dependent dehydrogenase (Short-subunit alcohol dehydrogenase family) n=1 Tax=Tepidamorphus gemmatus TaxID=747076 RepID=A0A4R3M5W3_9HYPH|nr:SDR family oxidoreductase [Tepidamorphus gemmatus]TCT08764.1 NAD(P)-dependent dehydrogenase (short-subunit alcohol dehydrogenase family) [Tepidamorphus gemmatus]